MSQKQAEITTFDQICTYDNIRLAYERARKRKTKKTYVIEFEQNLDQNIRELQKELITETYFPKPLKIFIIREPKTRKISKSEFRDRVIHHAICNIIEEKFDKAFIHDSYANRIGKGTLKAIKRFDEFKRKVSKNNTIDCYFLKADIKHYFETVNHNILIKILEDKIKDEKTIRLIKIILSNHKSEHEGKGMPLGNLTSQFFANVYLDKLDQYVKHELKIKYYIRYVDDFIILDHSIDILQEYKRKINHFLNEELKLELHPDKSKILPIERGANFLGFRIFNHHRLIRRKNLKKFQRKYSKIKTAHKKGLVSREKIIEKFEGWLTYINHADTYKYRRHLARNLNQDFPLECEIKLANIKKHENEIKRTDTLNFQYSPQKTLRLFNNKLTIKQIAEKRRIKESTVYEHLTKLIEYNQYSVWKVLQKEKIIKISRQIITENDSLKEIKQRINDNNLTYNEINLVLASIKARNKKKNILFHIKWYKNNYCRRKCFFDQKQMLACEAKFNQLISNNPQLNITRKEFLDLFNHHIKICTLSDKKKEEYVPWAEFKVRLALNKKTR